MVRRDGECRTCKGKGVISHNINFGSGPRCYDTFKCTSCDGTGLQRVVGKEATSTDGGSGDKIKGGDDE